MSTRRKFLSMAAAAVVLSFIGWVGTSFAPRGVTIQFSRYETNHYADVTYGGMPPGQLVFAVFVVSNSTDRLMACLSSSGTATWQSSGSRTGPAGGQPFTNVIVRGRGGVQTVPAVTTYGGSGTLDPGGKARIFMAVKDFQQPMRAWVEYQEVPGPNPVRDRLPRWLRWPQWQRSAAVTIQER